MNKDIKLQEKYINTDKCYQTWNALFTTYGIPLVILDTTGPDTA